MVAPTSTTDPRQTFPNTAWSGMLSNKPIVGGPKKKNSNVKWLGVVLIVLLLGSGMYRMFAKPPAPTTVMVVAAAKDLPPGYKLGFRDLHYLTLPKEFVNKGMVGTYGELVGRSTTSYIAMGEPILESSLMPGTQRLSDSLGVNERAFTLKLDDETAVDHSVMPGDRVDILATTSSDKGKKYTKTICQDVLVLMAVPKEMTLSDKLRSSDENKMTVAVKPEAAEELSEAAEISKLRVVLRNRTNHLSYVLSGSNDHDLLPDEAFRSENKDGAQKVAGASTEPPLPPPPPLSTPMTQIQTMVNDAGQAVAEKAKWVVDVFKGAAKESYDVSNN